MTVFRLIDEDDGAVLDTITTGTDGISYATGIGRDIVGVLVRRLGSQEAAVKALTDGGWSNGYLTIHADDQVAAAISKARAAVKALAAVDVTDPHRARRDQTVADTETQVGGGLRELAAGLVNGTTSPAAFIDDAVEVMRQGIRTGLAHGADHAHSDHLVKASIPVPPHSFPVPAGTGHRYHLYAGAVNRAYEQGYGLAALGRADDPDMMVVSWHAQPGACPLCRARDGKLFTVATLPGWPGEGQFGELCTGGPNCRCRLAYRTVGEAQARTLPANPPPSTPVQQRIAEHVADAREALAGPDPAVAFDLLLDQIADEQAEAQRPYLMGFAQDLFAARNRQQTPGTVAARWTLPDNDGGGWLVPAAVVTAALAYQLHEQAASQAQAAPATVGAPAAQPPP